MGAKVETFAQHTRQNLPLLVLAGLFIAGAVSGSGLYRTIGEDTSNTLMFLLSGSVDAPFHFFADWGAVLLSNLFVVAILFLCGFCAISQPVILLLPFVKGLGFGLVAAYNMALLTPYSAFFWLRFLPGAFLATALILLCAKQSLALSVFVFRSVFIEQPKAQRVLPRAYAAQYVFLTVLCVVFSLLDVLFDFVYEVLSNA